MVDRFGTGLARPVRFVSGAFVTASGPAKVLMCVSGLFSIPVGSIPWRCSLGWRGARLRHRNNTTELRQLARVDAGDALQKWEPRFRLRGVSLTPLTDGSRNVTDLTVYGEVVGLSGKVEGVKVGL